MRGLAIIITLLFFAVGQASAADGQRLADACLTCHGPEGQGSGAIPAIAGTDAAQMSAQLTGLRDGTTPATVMGRLMRGYSETEIAALANYLASLK